MLISEHALISSKVERGMASSSATAVPRLANRIQLDPQLDEQRQREYEALVCCTTAVSPRTRRLLISVTQEKEFQWLLEYEYTQKVDAIDKCIQVS